MQTLLLALALQVFFPLFNTSESEFTGLALVNRSNDAAQFSIRLISVDGHEAKVHTITVPKGQERFVLLNELMPGSGFILSGWVQVDSSTENYSAYMIASDYQTLSGVEPSSSPALASQLSDVRVNKGFRELAETDTAIAVVNPGNLPAEVRATVVGSNSIVQNDVALQVPPRATRTLRASDLILRHQGQFGVEFNGSILLTSTQPIASWMRVETPLSHRVAIGKPLNAVSAGSLTAPFFVTGGGYQSRLSVFNPGPDQLSLEVYAYDRQGLALGEQVPLTLPPGKLVSSDIDALLRIVTVASYPGPLISGSVRIREAGNRPFAVLASVTMTGLDAQDAQQSAMQYWVEPAVSQVWEIPYVTKSEQYFSAYAIANPNELLAVQTNVSIEVIGLDGSVVQRIERSLGPRMLEALMIDPPLPGSWMRITANLPIAVVGTIGTRDGRNMEAITSRPLPQ